MNNVIPMGSHLFIVMNLQYLYIVMHEKDLINHVRAVDYANCNNHERDSVQFCCLAP